MICTIGRTEEEVAEALAMQATVWNYLAFKTADQLGEWIRAVRHAQTSAVVGVSDGESLAAALS